MKTESIEEPGPTITISPSGLTFQGRPGQTLMAAANKAGLFWPTICGGEGRCLTCLVPADAGVNAALLPPDEYETAVLGRVGRSTAAFRLGCQARLTGRDVTLVNRKVRPAQSGDRLPFS